MSLSIGIVGLPNVGKSTLFTALDEQGRPRRELSRSPPSSPTWASCPCPTRACDALADDRPSGTRIVPADGRVRRHRRPGGAAPARARAWATSSSRTSARPTPYCEVVRFFSDPDVRARGRAEVDPTSDVDTIKTELILADMGTHREGHARAWRKRPSATRTAPRSSRSPRRCSQGLNEGHRARTFGAGRGRAGCHLRPAPARP